MVTAAVSVVGILLYVIYHARTGRLGESTVTYMAAEAEKIQLSEESEEDQTEA
ncbi:MAG: hypothetical protein QXP36_10425 [Conexivisphaerales archaeon]